MMLSKVRFARWVATEGRPLSVYPHESLHASERRWHPVLSQVRIGGNRDLC